MKALCTHSILLLSVLSLLSACMEQTDSAVKEEAIAGPAETPAGAEEEPAQEEYYEEFEGCVVYEEDDNDYACFALSLTSEGFEELSPQFYRALEPISGTFNLSIDIALTCQSLAAAIANVVVLDASAELDVMIDAPDQFIGYAPETVRLTLEPMASGEHQTMLRIEMTNGESLDVTVAFEALEPPPEEEWMGCGPPPEDYP